MVLGIVTVCLFVSGVIVSPSFADGYNILLAPAAAQSHVFPMLAIAEGLVSRGHNVTVLLPRNLKLGSKTAQRLDAVTVELYNDGDADYEKLYDDLYGDVMLREISLTEITSFAINQVSKLCSYLTERNEELFDELAKVDLDLVVVDGNFLTRCVYLLPHRLRVPVVTYTDALEPSLARVPWLTSIVPGTFTSFTNRMNFVERLLNTAAAIPMTLFSPSSRFLSKETLARYQQYGSFNSLDELAQKSLLWLYPRDHILDYPVPTIPNIINVGGLSAGVSASELSADLKSFIESSKRGSIVVSFGSLASRIPVQVARKFTDAFRQLDGVHVVWRWLRTEQDKLDVEIPVNVRIMDWLPQNDLLANSHVKLFITHCGNSGQYEALYHGVPMIGFPLAADQQYNAGRMVSKGFGIAMNIYSFTADELLANINEFLEDSSFKQRIAKASEIYRSAPMNAAETASFWIEHVCKYGGDHLRASGTDLPLHAFWMLDIAALLLLIASITIIISVTCARKIVMRIFYKKQRTVKAKVN